MAQFTTLIPHSDRVEEFVARYPSVEGCPAASSKEEALELASEKFLEELSWQEDSEDSEWLVQPEKLDAYEIYDEATYETVLGWEIDSI